MSKDDAWCECCGWLDSGDKHDPECGLLLARAEIARLTAERDMFRVLIAKMSLAVDSDAPKGNDCADGWRLLADATLAKVHELAAARAVPADVEAAIARVVRESRDGMRIGRVPAFAASEGGSAVAILRATIARAIREAEQRAVGDFIDGHAKRLCEQAGHVWNRDDEEAAEWASDVHDVLNHLRADETGHVHDGRKGAGASATVGGLLATAPVGSIVEWFDGDGYWHRMRVGETLASRWHAHPPKWSPPGFGMPTGDLRLPARLVPPDQADSDPSQRGPLPQDGCTHAVTHRGSNIPRRYGSWQSEVCDACGSFRARDHHGNLADMGRWREWRPASEYAAAIDDTDEGATRGPLPKGG